jgi:hypothetical protein
MGSRLVACAAIGAAVLAGCSVGQHRAAAIGDRCVAAADARQQDVDREDSPEALWPHTPGTETVVYFTVGGLAPRYARAVRTGAQAWSRNPCVDARVADACPAGAHCSTVREARESGDEDTDGESEVDDVRGVRRGDTITLYTGLLDAASDNGVQATVTHEMGHALGLVHRRDTDSVMNAETDDDTDPEPDEVDHANLIVLYGARAGGA